MLWTRGKGEQAVFKCTACGYEENADVNAARNILTVGQTGIAKRTAVAVGSRNLQETARKYCPWLHRSQRNPLRSRGGGCQPTNIISLLTYKQRYEIGLHNGLLRETGGCSQSRSIYLLRTIFRRIIQLYH